MPEHVYYVAVNKVLDLRNKVVDKRPSRNAGMVVRHFLASNKKRGQLGEIKIRITSQIVQSKEEMAYFCIDRCNNNDLSRLR